MQNLSVVLNDSHIAVLWEPPAFPNGIVTYFVAITEMDLFSTEITSLFNDDTAELELIFEYAVVPYSEYNINVTSQTSAGLGETEQLVLQTSESGETYVRVT